MIMYNPGQRPGCELLCYMQSRRDVLWTIQTHHKTPRRGCLLMPSCPRALPGVIHNYGASGTSFRRYTRLDVFRATPGAIHHHGASGTSFDATLATTYSVRGLPGSLHRHPASGTFFAPYATLIFALYALGKSSEDKSIEKGAATPESSFMGLRTPQAILYTRLVIKKTSGCGAGRLHFKIGL